MSRSKPFILVSIIIVLYLYMFVLLTLNVDCVNCFAVVYEVFISIQSIVNCSKSLFNNLTIIRCTFNPSKNQ